MVNGSNGDFSDTEPEDEEVEDDQPSAVTTPQVTYIMNSSYICRFIPKILPAFSLKNSSLGVKRRSVLKFFFLFLRRSVNFRSDEPRPEAKRRPPARSLR